MRDESFFCIKVMVALLTACLAKVSKAMPFTDPFFCADAIIPRPKKSSVNESRPIAVDLHYENILRSKESQLTSLVLMLMKVKKLMALIKQAANGFELQRKDRQGEGPIKWLTNLFSFCLSKTRKALIGFGERQPKACDYFAWCDCVGPARVLCRVLVDVLLCARCYLNSQPHVQWLAGSWTRFWVALTNHDRGSSFQFFNSRSFPYGLDNRNCCLCRCRNNNSYCTQKQLLFLTIIVEPVFCFFDS